MDNTVFKELWEVLKKRQSKKYESLEADTSDFIAKRCEKALIENVQYLELQNQLADVRQSNDIHAYSELNSYMQSIVENICYEAAVNDIYLLIGKRGSGFRGFVNRKELKAIKLALKIMHLL